MKDSNNHPLSHNELDDTWDCYDEDGNLISVDDEDFEREYENMVVDLMAEGYTLAQAEERAIVVLTDPEEWK